MQTLFIGKNLIFLPQVHSTNSYAIDLLKNVKLAEGTVIHTSFQTRGKGQRGASWLAPEGQNLTASFILRPHFLELSNQFFLYQIVALACYDTITELLNSSHIDIKIKWPNDILLGTKKIAGILIENSIQHNQLNWSVIGIGINVNQDYFDTHLNASSLKLISNKEFDIQTVLTLVCQYLEKYYLMLINSKYNLVQETYLERLYGLNTFHDFEIDSEIHSLLIKGVSANGLLILEDKNGIEKVVDVKEARLLY